MDKRDGDKPLVPVYTTKGKALRIVNSFTVAGKSSKKKKPQRKGTSAQESPTRILDGSEDVSMSGNLDTIADAATPEDSSRSEPAQPETSLTPNTSVSEELDSLIEDDELLVVGMNSDTGDGVSVPSDGSTEDGDSLLSKDSQDPDCFTQYYSELESDADVQLVTISKKRPKPRTSRHIADITFPGVRLGAVPEFHALRCDESCPEHAEVDGDELGGAHTWCLTHSRYHCRGIANEVCRDVVLCGVSVEVYRRMRMDWLEEEVESGGDSDDGSDPSDEGDSGYDGGTENKRQEKDTLGKKNSTSILVAAQLLEADIPNGSSKSQNKVAERTKGGWSCSAVKINSILKKRKAEGKEEEGPGSRRKKHVKFSDGIV
ncbi:hypothetical protein BKA61DRAFT_727816, partial [Leptodontidium sp. MPI-SDFR-AT-0119]